MTVVKLRLTNASVEFLRDNKIYLSYPNVGFEIQFNKGSQVEPYVKFGSGGHDRKNLHSMGAFSYITSNSTNLNLNIGRYSSISWGLKFTVDRGSHNPNYVSTHPFVNLDQPHVLDFIKDNLIEYTQRFNDYPGQSIKKNISIGHDVWIGAFVTINPGVQIGHGSIIASDSVVTKSVPPYEIWGGNPARLIKKRFSDDLIERLLLSEWFDYKFTDFNGIPLNDPVVFCDHFLKFKNDFEKYKPPLILLDDCPGESLD
jgi:acetyltransferase-like isoleucine patch superfamily enzyme